MMKFGTAGLRAAMGAGFSRMNDLTVIQATQGLCKYLEDTHGSGFKVLIGYDGRHNSQRFAKLAATAFLSQGAFVYLFSEMNPTPYVAYGTKKLGCVAGVMVTASHNPKEDNGYKVYWANGAQINSPHDKEIASRIAKFNVPWADAWNADLHVGHANCEDPFAFVHEHYHRDILVHSHLDKAARRDLAPLTYTAMHGIPIAFVTLNHPSTHRRWVQIHCARLRGIRPAAAHPGAGAGHARPRFPDCQVSQSRRGALWLIPRQLAHLLAGQGCAQAFHRDSRGQSLSAYSGQRSWCVHHPLRLSWNAC